MSARTPRMDFRVRDYQLDLQDRRLVEGLRLELRPGEAVGLVGANGSGKSLLLASWIGWAPAGVAGSGAVALGERLLHDGRGPCRDALDEVVGRHLGIVLSEPGVHLNPAISAADQLRLACELQPAGPPREARLEIVGLSPLLLDRYPAYLSSGQRQRLAVACSLLGRGILVCDDPAASLDPILRAQFFAELERSKARGELGVLLLAAREQDLPAFVDRLVPLSGLPAASRPAPRAVRIDVSDAGSGPTRSVGARLASPFATGVPAIRVQGLGVRRDGQTVLSGVDLEVRHGEIVLLVGESGAGKSTLLEALARTVAVEPGSQLEVLGQDLLRLKPEVGRPDPPAMAELRRRVRIAFPDPDTVFDPAQPTASVLERFAQRSFEDLELCNRLREHLEARRGVPIGRLGGWDKRALGLWAALDRRTEVLLADEPLAGADPENLELTLDGFRELASRGAAVLIVTHLLPPVAPLAHRVAVFHRGRLVEVLEGGALLDRPEHPYTRQLVAAALSSGSEQHRKSRGARAGAVVPPPPPFELFLGCQAQLRGERAPYLCAADAGGRLFVLEEGAWRATSGEESDSISAVLALRGLDAETLLESVPISRSQNVK